MDKNVGVALDFGFKTGLNGTGKHHLKQPMAVFKTATIWPQFSTNVVRIDNLTFG